MCEIPNKDSNTIANLVEQKWLTCYPWPNKVIFDRGCELMGDFAKMIQNDYGVTKRPAMTRNPQANSILERVHQTIGNMIRIQQVGSSFVDENDPWSGILAATMFAI